MKRPALIIALALLALVTIIVIMRESQKAKAQKAAIAASAQETAILLQAIQYRQNRDVIDAESKATLSDWLNTFGSLGDAASSIFTGINLGGGS